jgi:hypothetical protein
MLGLFLSMVANFSSLNCPPPRGMAGSRGANERFYGLQVAIDHDGLVKLALHL